MPRVRLLCLVVSCALSIPVQAQSQATPRPDASVAEPGPRATAAPSAPALGIGRKELTIGGSFTGSKSSAAASTFRVFELSTHLGFVVSRHLEVLAGTNVTKIGDLDPRGAITGGVLFNFTQDGRIVPFAGATVGKALGAAVPGSTTSQPLILDLSGGFRVMTPGGGGALVVRPFYQRQLHSINVAGQSDFHRFGVSFGPSILF
jgi:hypothetical protein